MTPRDMDAKSFRRINLRIGRQDPIPFSIPADTDTEKHLRQGAGEVNRLLAKYEAAYPDASDKEVMTYVAIHLANDLVTLRDAVDSLRLSEVLSDLLSDLDDANRPK